MLFFWGGGGGWYIYIYIYIYFFLCELWAGLFFSEIHPFSLLWRVVRQRLFSCLQCHTSEESKRCAFSSKTLMKHSRPTVKSRPVSSKRAHGPSCAIVTRAGRRYQSEVCLCVFVLGGTSMISIATVGSPAVMSGQSYVSWAWGPLNLNGSLTPGVQGLSAQISA